MQSIFKNPSIPDSAHIAKAAYVKTLSSHTFDTAYIYAQVIDHMNTIDLFNKELSNGNNSLIKNLATMNLRIIKMHLQMALDIQPQLR